MELSLWSGAVLIALLSGQNVNDDSQAAAETAIDRLRLGLAVLWPDSGTSRYVVREEASWTDRSANGSISAETTLGEFEVRRIGEKFHVVWRKANRAGILVTEYEMLDQDDCQLRLHSPGSEKESIVQAPRFGDKGSRDETQKRLKLITGTISSATFPRIREFLDRNNSQLHVEVNRDRAATVACTETDGTLWSFEFEMLENGVVVPRRIHQEKQYLNGTYKKYTEEMSEVEHSADPNNMPFIRRFKSRWTSELRDGFSRTAEVAYTVTEFSYSPDNTERLAFVNAPREGGHVKVLNSDWLHHEWRDGKVVQVTDPEAMKQLDEFKFSNEGIGWKRWAMIIGSIALAGGGFLLFRRRSAAVLLVVLSSGEVSAKEAARQEFDYSQSGATP